MVQAAPDRATKETEPHLEAFKRFETEAKQPAWLFPLRKAGIVRFAELGFPTVHDEDWRFTNLALLAKLPFNPVLTPPAAPSPEVLQRFPFAKLPGTRLVFLDGHFSAELSVRPALPAGVRVSSLAAVLAEEPALLEKLHRRDRRHRLGH